MACGIVSYSRTLFSYCWKVIKCYRLAKFFKKKINQSNSHTACACYYTQEVPVLFVDYGIEERVTDVVMMTKQLLNQLPFQAIPVQLSDIVLNHWLCFFCCCGLYGLLCTAGLSAIVNFEAFEEMVLNKQFYCYRKGVDSITNSYIVSLMDCKLTNLFPKNYQRKMANGKYMYQKK